MDEPCSTVVTRGKIASPPGKVFASILFYEELDRPPPLFLRLLLPVPKGVKGGTQHVGDQVTCLYERGSLVKQITQIDRSRYEYAFDVIAQEVKIFGGLRLLRGGISLRELPGGSAEISLRTEYYTICRPRWLWRQVERGVCHLFHKYLIVAYARRTEIGRN